MKYFRWLLKFPFARTLAIAWPLTGVGLVGYGAWLIFPPAGYIAVGSLLILDMLHASLMRRKAK